MLQQRMQSAIMQDKSQVQSLWKSFDTSGNGYLEFEEFMGALKYMGVNLLENVAAKFMNKFASHRSKITYEEFFINMLGLPPDFASSKSKSPVKNKRKKNQPAQLSHRFITMLPVGTPIEAVDKLFRSKLRKLVLNVDRCVFSVLKKPSATAKSLDRDALFNIFVAIGSTPTKTEIEDLMNFYDPQRKGKLNYEEFARNILKLPRKRCAGAAGGVQRSSSELEGRPKILVESLRIHAERAAATPSDLLGMFRRFDPDGSGKISYDEMALMVRTFECNVEGEDMASRLLRRYCGDDGAMTYVTFLTRVLGLRKDALRDPGMPDMPCTPEVQQQVSSSFKKVLYNNQEAITRAFAAFDRDGSGQLSAKEFADAIEELDLPISSKHARELFEDYDSDNSGRVTIEELSKQILKQPPACTHRGNRPQDLMLSTLSSIGPRTGRSDSSRLSTASSRYTYDSQDARQAATMSTKELRQHLTKMHLTEPVAGSVAASITRRSISTSGSRPRSHNSFSIDSALDSARSALSRSGACTPQPQVSSRSSPTARSCSALRGFYPGAPHSASPKTQSQLRAEGRLSSRRHTFDQMGLPSSHSPPSSCRSRLIPIRADTRCSPEMTSWAESRYMATPGNGVRLPGRSVPLGDVPNPVQKSHKVDGTSTYDLKSVGAFGGAGKKGNRNWIGGADRTCNALMAQPNMPF